MTEADTSKVAQLVDMGLSPSEARKALELAQNDIERALALHFDPSLAAPATEMPVIRHGTPV
jgi:uncharacterized UBP type Zn finger protein